MRKALRWSRRLVWSLTSASPVRSWCAGSADRQLRAVVADREKVVGDRRDVDLLGDLARLQEGVGELLLRRDVRLLHRGHPGLEGLQGSPGIVQGDALLLGDRLRVLVLVLDRPGELVGQPLQDVGESRPLGLVVQRTRTGDVVTARLVDRREPLRQDPPTVLYPERLAGVPHGPR